ncbi:MAG: hypothetical protein J5606_02565, partial [Bacteroidales bacterium]|nr:hypothetical protein [Bacteroidales bacterium]
MKKVTKFFMAALLAVMCSFGYGQNKQWEMYTKIPKLNRIELNLGRNSYNGNKELNFVINSDYTVSVNCYSKMNLYDGGSSIDLNLSGRGLLTWQSEKMVIQLNITESTPGGKYEYQTCQDKWSFGQVVGTQWNNYYYSFPRSENKYSYSFVLEYGKDEDGEFFKLIGNEINLITNGNLRVITDYGGRNFETNSRFEYKSKISITNKPIRFTAEYKSDSELNADNSD